MPILAVMSWGSVVVHGLQDEVFPLPYTLVRLHPPVSLWGLYWVLMAA